MASHHFTLTSYDPVYVVAEEIRIPEDAIKDQAIRWLKNMICKAGEEPKLTDSWISTRTEDFKSVDDLLIFIRYNMYKDSRELQELADQDVICKELATRLVEE